MKKISAVCFLLFIGLIGIYVNQFREKNIVQNYYDSKYLTHESYFKEANNIIVGEITKQFPGFYDETSSVVIVSEISIKENVRCDLEEFTCIMVQGPRVITKPGECDRYAITKRW